MNVQEWVKWWQSLPPEEKRRRREQARQRQAVGHKTAMRRIRRALLEKFKEMTGER